MRVFVCDNYLVNYTNTTGYPRFKNKCVKIAVFIFLMVICLTFCYCEGTIGWFVATEVVIHRITIHLWPSECCGFVYACWYDFVLFFFSAHMKDILEKEAIENAAAKCEEEKLQQMKEEQDKMQRKQSQKEEEMLQARRKADEGM